MSMKKSLLLVVAVIVMVTAFQLMTSGGNAMLIDMSDTAISFSGIDDFREEIPYSEIASAELLAVQDWSSYQGHEFGQFRVRSMGEGEHYGLFVTTQADCVVALSLSDGRQMFFNYNNVSDTQAIYNLLLENVQ